MLSERNRSLYKYFNPIYHSSNLYFFHLHKSLHGDKSRQDPHQSSPPRALTSHAFNAKGWFIITREPGCDSADLWWWFRELFKLPSYSSPSSSPSECSPQEQVFQCKRRNLGCSSAEGRSSTTNSVTKTAVLLGEVASRCFPHHTLSLAFEQILKDLKRSQGHQRGGEESGFD